METEPGQKAPTNFGNKLHRQRRPASSKDVVNVAPFTLLRELACGQIGCILEGAQVCPQFGHCFDFVFVLPYLGCDERRPKHKVQSHFSPFADETFSFFGSFVFANGNKSIETP